MQRRIEMYACLGFVGYLASKSATLSLGRNIEEYKIFFVVAAILVIFSVLMSLRKSDRLFRITLYPLTFFAGGILGRLESSFVCGFSLDYAREALLFISILALWAVIVLFMFNPHEKITKNRLVLGIILLILSLFYLNLEVIKWQLQLAQAGDAGPGEGSRVVQTEAMDYEGANKKQQRNILIVGAVVVFVSGGWWVYQRVQHCKHQNLP